MASLQMGRGILWSDGDSHKRQRKAMAPGFSNVKIREYTPIFYDAAYKVREYLDVF
jgi:cytochrome P450